MSIAPLTRAQTNDQLDLSPVRVDNPVDNAVTSPRCTSAKSVGAQDCAKIVRFRTHSRGKARTRGKIWCSVLAVHLAVTTTTSNRRTDTGINYQYFEESTPIAATGKRNNGYFFSLPGRPVLTAGTAASVAMNTSSLSAASKRNPARSNSLFFTGTAWACARCFIIPISA